MSGFTITAGVSFSGGFTFTEAPVENTAAWFGGGGVVGSSVDRITFTTDTATASVRGPLSLARAGLAATGNYTQGWFGGGRFPFYSTVDRITYATDTATASSRGPLSVVRAYLAAAGNTTDGWFAGGGDPTVYRAIVDRITYATDTATASVRGSLSAGRYGLASAGNSDYGWFGGGAQNGDPGGLRSTVDRITYATDTATASVRGPLSLANRTFLAATGNTTDGWFSGWSAVSTVDRITYANDTATASVRGPLSAVRAYMAAAGNTTDGWFGGGYTHGGGGQRSIVNRITYATDTAAASVRGPLSSANSSMGAAGGIQ